MNRIMIMVAIASIASSGAALAYARDRTPEPEVRSVGVPKNCVSTHQIRSTRIVDERTIDFKMAGGKTYRNSMRHSCPGLKFEEKFLYRTSTGRLCSVDFIRVLSDFGGRLSEGAGCGLGKFQQVERVNPTT